MDKKQESAHETDLETLAFFSSSSDSRTRGGCEQTACGPLPEKDEAESPAAVGKRPANEKPVNGKD